MKTIFYFLTLALLAASCSQNKPGIVTNLHTDSLRIGEKLFYLDSIGEKDFNRVRKIEPRGNIDTNLVKIYPDSILVKAVAKNVVYRNDTTEGESLATYEINSILTDPGYVHIKGWHWEWTTDRYINLKSGIETDFWDNPILSPDKRHVVAFSCDLEAGFMPNGIQLFQINSEHIEKVFEKEIDDWGPEKIKWESDTSLVIKRLRLDENMQPKYDYLRLLLK